MPKGSTDADFISIWQTKLFPAVDKFKPDLVLISAGFDSKQGDLLGTFSITPAGFAALTSMASDIADSYCSGRLVSMLEGGYADLDGVGYKGLALSVERHIETLLLSSDR